MRILWLLLCGIYWLPVHAQVDKQALRDFNDERIALTQKGMQALGYWSIGNIATGLFFRSQTDGQTKAFHTMNAGWNLVNLGIATAGYIGLKKQRPSRFDLQETIREQYNMQKVLLFNAGLDLGYMVGGLYLRERAAVADNPDQLRGWGNSILLQGGFLFVYDGVMAYLHSRRNKKLDAVMEGIDLTAGIGGVGLRYTF